MFSRLAVIIERRHRLVLLLAAGFIVAGGVFGIGVGQHLGVGGFYAPGRESTLADEVFDDAVPNGPHNLVVVADAGVVAGVDSAQAMQSGSALTQFLQQEPGISSVVSYWPDHVSQLRSSDGGTALVLARITGDEDQRKATLARIFPRISGEHDGLSLTPGGQPAVEREVTANSEDDLRRMELLAAPLVALILLFVFGSLVSSLLPLVIGLTAIVGTLVTLRTLTAFTDVSMYSLNIATALSLGLAIDYGLFIVTRYREELDAGASVPDAIATTLSTAGRTVLFSSITVAVSLSALLIFPLYYLRSFAYAGMAVVAFACFSALVVLPAVLMLLGHRVDRWDVAKGFAKLRNGQVGRWRGYRMGRHRRLIVATGGRLSRSGTGRWHRMALFVMRRPIPLAVGVVTVLVILGSPFFGVRYALPDASNLPADSDSSRVIDRLHSEFPDLSMDAMYMVSPDRQLTPEETTSYAAAVSAVAGVVSVQSAAGSFAHGQQVIPATPDAAAVFNGPQASWLSVGLQGDPQGQTAEAAVASVRALEAPAPMLVGGIAAHLTDTKATLAQALPWALAVVAVATLILLFLFTGSVLIPIKAVLLNLLSLTATFGAAVWIFQDGNLRWLVGDFQTNGAIELTTPILLFAIAFGLSMDYELFLLSRIKEEYQRTGDNTTAVASGLERTGRLVTYAALLFIVVMVAFATSDLSVLKLVGVGLGLAVLMDATLIRSILVPAVMRLAGRANWWAPAPLRALHQRIGLHEGEEPSTHSRRNSTVEPLAPSRHSERTPAAEHDLSPRQAQQIPALAGAAHSTTD